MADSVNSDCARDFWTEAKQINSAGKSSPSSIDGRTGDSAIAPAFAENYNNLYNSVSYDQDAMSHLESEINNRIEMRFCMAG